MRFTAISAAAALAFASSVLAQTTGFNSIAIPVSVDAGKSAKISWTAPTFTDSDVKVELIGGADFAHLVPIQVIVPSIKNSALGYDWTVASELGKDATYGIRISLVSDPSTFQYSNAFKIVGGTVTVSSSTTSASASASGYPVSVPTTSATVIVSVTSSVVISSSVVVVPTVSSSVVVPATTSAVIPATTSTTTAAATLTTLTSAKSSSASATTTAATAVATAAGAQATVGVVALFGGLAAALMAM